MATSSENEVFIKAKSDSKFFRATPGNLELKVGDEILFEFEQCQDTGLVVSKENANTVENSEEEGFTIIRKLTEKDQERLGERTKEAKETLIICEEKIKKHGLSMELLDAGLSYDGKKLTFYFVAPGRVDFRSLVPDLASTFKKLIRLQQVGFRDKAKCTDGIGRCGREICCRAFLRGDLDNISMDMAYEQNLGQMGSNRVMGVCGKLQCCLKFELEHYKNKKAKMPAVGSEIKTPEGIGTVLSQKIIKSKVLVELAKDKRVVEVDC